MKCPNCMTEMSQTTEKDREVLGEVEVERPVYQCTNCETKVTSPPLKRGPIDLNG